MTFASLSFSFRLCGSGLHTPGAVRLDSCAVSVRPGQEWGRQLGQARAGDERELVDGFGLRLDDGAAGRYTAHVL